MGDRVETKRKFEPLSHVLISHSLPGRYMAMKTTLASGAALIEEIKRPICQPYSAVPRDSSVEMCFTLLQSF